MTISGLNKAPGSGFSWYSAQSVHNCISQSLSNYLVLVNFVLNIHAPITKLDLPEKSR